jgi:hypothetical protein
MPGGNLKMRGNYLGYVPFGLIKQTLLPNFPHHPHFHLIFVSSGNSFFSISHGGDCPISRPKMYFASQPDKRKFWVHLFVVFSIR